MKKQKGSGLIFAVILLFVILGMVVTLSSITILETKMSQKTKSSVGAFYNSESGVEWALNKIATETGDNISDVFGTATPGNGVAPTGADYKVYLLDEDGKIITTNRAINEVQAVRSVGIQNNETQRAIEAAVAAGSGGCYTCYKDTSSGDCCNTEFQNKIIPLGTITICGYGGSGNAWAYLSHPGMSCNVAPGIVGSWVDGTAYVCCR